MDNIRGGGIAIDGEMCIYCMFICFNISMTTISIKTWIKKNIHIPSEFSSWDEVFIWINAHRSDLLSDEIAEFIPVSDDEVPLSVLQDIIKHRKTSLSEYTNI